MSSVRILANILILLSASSLIAYLIMRLLRRGISRRYDRQSTKARQHSPWSALSAGEDPTLSPLTSSSSESESS